MGEVVNFNSIKLQLYANNNSGKACWQNVYEITA